VLSATKRAAIFVIKARNGRAADPKSIQINKIMKEKNIFL
jgi:phage gp16-like protein